LRRFVIMDDIVIGNRLSLFSRRHRPWLTVVELWKNRKNLANHKHSRTTTDVGWVGSWASVVFLYVSLVGIRGLQLKWFRHGGHMQTNNGCERASRFSFLDDPPPTKRCRRLPLRFRCLPTWPSSRVYCASSPVTTDDADVRLLRRFLLWPNLTATSDCWIPTRRNPQHQSSCFT